MRRELDDNTSPPLPWEHVEASMVWEGAIPRSRDCGACAGLAGPWGSRGSEGGSDKEVRGWQGGPSHGSDREGERLSSSGAVNQVRSCPNPERVSSSSSGGTLGFHSAFPYSPKIRLVEQVCGFAWASAACWKVRGLEIGDLSFR
jgi:hypothetical protein